MPNPTTPLPRGARTEYRVVREWQSGNVTRVTRHLVKFDSLDDAKAHLKKQADLWDAGLRGGWIETRTVTEWTKA